MIASINTTRLDDAVNDDIDIALRPSIRQFIIDNVNESSDVDFFQEKSSFIDSPRKEESPISSNDCRYKQQFDTSMTPIIDSIESCYRAIDAKVDDCMTDGYRRRSANDLSTSSCYMADSIDDNDRLDKIREVSFEQSSARPSIKDRVDDRSVQDRRFDAVNDGSNKDEQNKPSHAEVVKSKRIDLAELKRKYLAKNIEVKEPSQQKKDSKISDEIIGEQFKNNLKATFQKKKAAKEVCCLSRSSVDISASTVLTPKYHISDSLKKNYYETSGFVKQAGKVGGIGLGFKKKKSRNQAKSFKQSDISESVSLSCTFEKHGLRKSLNMSSQVIRSRSPFEGSSTFITRTTDGNFVNIKHQLREHHRTTVRERDQHKSKTKMARLFEVEPPKIIMHCKNNLFRDPMLRKPQTPHWSKENHKAILIDSLSKVDLSKSVQNLALSRSQGMLRSSNFTLN